jgi:ABC-2 type transport system permease protein
MTTLRILGAFIRRDWAVTRSYRTQGAFAMVGMVFQLTLFYFVSRFIDQDRFGDEAGISGGYFSFVIVGMALLNIIRAALTSISRTLQTEQTTGSLEALLITPQSSALLIVASSTFSFMRSVINLVLFLGLGMMVFGVRFNPNPWSLLTALVALIAALAIFATLGMVVAAVTLVYKRANAFQELITSSIALLGGVYFPVSVLPEPLRIIAELLPITWALATVRLALLNGVVDLQQLLILAVTAVLALPTGIWAMNLALRQARRDGSLTQY